MNTENNKKRPVARPRKESAPQDKLPHDKVSKPDPIPSIAEEVLQGEPYMLFTKGNLEELLEKYRMELIEDIEKKSGTAPSGQPDAEEKSRPDSTVTSNGNPVTKKKASDFPEAPSSRLELYKQLDTWIKHVEFPDFVKSISAQVIGQEGLEDILFNIYLYLYNRSLKRSISNNLLLASPSGCGKTETFRALKRYFSIEIPSLPVVQVDLTGITPAGFVGRDITDLIEPLAALHSDGTGLVFMDEFDKCLISQYQREKNNLNKEVQNGMLTLIEGIYMDRYQVDTGYTMFIGMGAFDVFRKQRALTNKKYSFGFAVTESATPDENLHYEPITINDLKDQGAIPELLGRFVSIVNYHALTPEAVDRIIDKEVKSLSGSMGIPLVVGDKVRSHLHTLANTEYGCRSLHNALHNRICQVLKQHLLEGKKLNQLALFLEEI